MRFEDQLEEARSLRRTGKFNEALYLLENLISTLDVQQHHEKILCLNEQSHCLWTSGQYDKAETCAAEALHLAEQSPPDLEGQGTAFLNLAAIFYEKCEMNQVEEFCQRGLAFFEKISNKKGIADSLNLLGMASDYQGHLDQAEEYYKRSLAFREELGDAKAIGDSLGNLGVLYWERGDMDRAEEYFLQCLALDEKIDNPAAKAATLANLGDVCKQRGELEQAEEFYRQSLVLREEVENQYEIAESRFQLAQVLLRKGNHKEAVVQIDLLAQLAEVSNNPEIAAKYQYVVGLQKLSQQELTSALQHCSKAKKLAAQSSYFILQIEVSHLLVQILLQLYLLTKQKHHREQIENLLEESRYLSKREHLRGVYLETLLMIGFLKRIEFDLLGAIDQFELVELLSIESGIQPLAERAKNELVRLQKQVTLYQRLQDEAPQVYEQIQIQEMLAYMQAVKQYSAQSYSNE
jgi:tetratricopeptide (TPR) repeat protein